MNEESKPLWSEGVDLEKLIRRDGSTSDHYIFNLWEDIICLKEEVKSLKDEKEWVSKVLEDALLSTTTCDTATGGSLDLLAEIPCKLDKGE